ncbi:uncharacterized protein [Physcomitrium patens]|nr:uncharacterized protein LOC112282752 isoform X2 [Physcomitrium patens]PNR54346.1 hypothetical protein PHYPA_008023 [Physcomitrium patens]|eukprot:XP_024376577.1 uncharacterized protein LOC112282752 isoform X2 [Physcomitrella patens]
MADGHELASMSNVGPQQDGSTLTPILWACGAVSQAIAARVLAKKGDGGPSMPIRAFSIASLLLGTGFCAVGGTLWASGIREVEDLRGMGRTVRSAFGKPPRMDT